jgi:2-polyprenyl-6-methoxyphenol hydroxylase-like FAD-dependent oxidoreductase
MSDRLDVLVVGAGPTGLVMASELVRGGVRCRIIEKSPTPSTTSKALAVHARTLELFERLGIADAAVAAGVPARGLSIFSDRRRIVHVDFDRIASRYPYVLILPQNRTERLLEERLRGVGLTVERGLELVGLTQRADGVEAVLGRADRFGNERVHAGYVVGCDGSQSTVRQMLNLAFTGEVFEETFSLADIRLDWEGPDDRATIYLCRGDLVALFPMPQKRYRIVVERHAAGESNRERTLADFQAVLDTCGAGRARLSDPSWISDFRVSQRRVASYRRGRVFLAGDAAHIHSPLGGQGMNTGIQDACNLGWKLGLVVAGRAHPGLLDSYERERQLVARILLRATGVLTRAVLAGNPVVVQLRDRATSLLTSFSAVQNRITRSLAELDINYRKSPIVRECPAPGVRRRLRRWFGAEPGPQAGDRAPDATVVRVSDGTPRRLFELFSGTRHTLLIFSGRSGRSEHQGGRQDVVELVTCNYRELIDPYVVVPGPLALVERGETSDALGDPDGLVHRAYTADDEAVYLIRPDGYVGFRGRQVDAEALQAYLDDLFVAVASPMHGSSVPSSSVLSRRAG